MTQSLFHNKETLTFFSHCVHLIWVMSNVAACWFLQGLGIFRAGHKLFLGLVLSLAGCNITPISMPLVLSFIDWHTSLFDVIWLSQDLETWCWASSCPLVLWIIFWPSPLYFHTHGWQVMILIELRWCLVLVIRSLGSMMSFPGCIMLYVCQFNILSVALNNFVAYVLFTVIAIFFHIYTLFIYVYGHIFFSVSAVSFHSLVCIL